MDATCRDCMKVVPYDGVDDALFCLSKTNIFTRGLLDHWLYEVCAVGTPFRDVYSSWMRFSTSVSSGFINIGKSPSINRQRCNEALNQFMLTLRFSDDELETLFSCSNCEQILPSGIRNRWCRDGWYCCWNIGSTATV